MLFVRGGSLEADMLLNLKELFADSRQRLDFDYTMDLSGYEMGNGEFPFREPVRVSGYAENHAGAVTLSAAVDFHYFTLCDRCLKDIMLNLSVPFENVLTKTGSGEDTCDSCEQ